MKRSSFSLPRRSGFTLVEIMVVITIMAILAVAVVQGMKSTPASSLSAAAVEVMDDLFLARQMAIAQNRPVEIWFIRPSSGGPFQSIQIYIVDDAGNLNPQGRMQTLPTSVNIDSSATLSPLMQSSQARSWGSTTQPNLKPYGKLYDCRYVSFLADGSANLPTSQSWFLTLHASTEHDGLSALPSNYAVIEIEPANGRATLYRP